MHMIMVGLIVSAKETTQEFDVNIKVLIYMLIKFINYAMDNSNVVRIYMSHNILLTFRHVHEDGCQPLPSHRETCKSLWPNS